MCYTVSIPFLMALNNYDPAEFLHFIRSCNLKPTIKSDAYSLHYKYKLKTISSRKSG